MPEEVKQEVKVEEKPADQKLAEKIYDKTDEKGEPKKEPEKKVEEKPAEDKKPEEKVSEKPEGEKKSEPAKLELKLPEGSLLDAKRVDEIASFAKEQGLSQKAAQALLERESGAKASFEENAQREFKAHTDGWLKECESDKEIGGAGFKENIAHAHRAIEKFGSPELKRILDEGFGNHPELVKTFVRIGKVMASDKLVTASTQPARKKTLEEKFYPNTAQK